MEKETKGTKFQRLAEKRTNDVINKLRLISNLANRRNYDYTDEQVLEMFRAIENELKYSKKEFSQESNEENSSFRFSVGDKK